MESVDDVWASMKDNETDRISELRKRTTALKSKSSVSVVDLIKKADAKAKKITASHAPPQLLDDSTAAILGIDNRKKTTSSVTGTKKKATAVTTQTMELECTFADQLTVSDEKKVSTEASDDINVQSVMKASEMLPKIARDLNLANSDDVNERRRALQRVHKILFEDCNMSTGDYNEVFRESCKSIFKRFNDPSEKCRELALKITLAFFERASDLVSVLGYFFPVLMQRLPGGLAYDEDMKVFVTDIESHEAYRRGKAVDRQDRIGGAANGTIGLRVVEPSEEIRHLACRVLCTLLRRALQLGTSSILHPYFHEAVMFLQVIPLGPVSVYYPPY